MISHKHKWIFVLIPKTASSSIKGVLEKYDEGCVHLGHANAGWHKNTYKREWEEYFKFTFVRNPWALRYSYYCYNKTVNGRHGKYARRLSFKDWVKRYLRKGFFGTSQMEMIGDVSNFDFIGRVENLQEDFNIVCDKIGIPHQELPHKNATKHKHYSEYYDDELKAIMERRYKKDIETFGYKFGE